MRERDTKTSATPPGSGQLTPQVIHDYRARLTHGEDVIDPDTWAGAIPAASGIAPRLRIGANRWFNVLWLVPIGFVLLICAVAAAKGLRGIPGVAQFIQRHPGIGYATHFDEPMPGWVRVQHFMNLFFLLFIIRAGIQILADHPRLYWTRHSTPGKEWLRMQKPVPADPLWTAKQDSLTLPKHVGLPGLRHSIGLARWWHLGIDVL
ncbi:MAG: oxidoreductase, partial [Deltaproteobacteria bacterium]